jgi:hypothetical protein
MQWVPLVCALMICLAVLGAVVLAFWSTWLSTRSKCLDCGHDVGSHSLILPGDPGNPEECDATDGLAVVCDHCPGAGCRKNFTFWQVTRRLVR